MAHILIDTEIILAIVLIISILLQHQGTGLGGAFGGEGNFYRSRRGLEKVLFYFTIIIAILFALVALVLLVVK
ncbi:MAG: preprotein translocase subunit SecG [bacterium]|nr:preprotein translocase subunit SecG [bacterium]